MRPSRTATRQPSGYTLLEIVLAGTIFALVVLTFLMVYDANEKTFLRGEKAGDLQQNARVAMERLVRELRMSGYAPGVPAAQASPAIRIAQFSRIQFVADVDSDGTTEQVTYALNSGMITREQRRWTGSAWDTGTGALPLASRITSLSFAYYDASNNVIALSGDPPAVSSGGLASIRRIRVTTVTTDTVAGQMEQQAYTLTSDVRPRNLGP